jgi:hypothetical protein
LPDRGTGVEAAVQEIWDLLQAVDSIETLAVFKRLPKVTERLAPYSDDEVLKAIQAAKSGKAERPVKQVELDALLAAPEGFGDDVPVDQNFHARRLPDHAWRHTKRSDSIEAVIQLHRLREVLALVGFTRFEAVTPDIQGEYETDVERAQIALEPSWFPAVENRGEGIFVQLRAAAVLTWLARPAVEERLSALAIGHQQWMKDRKSQRAFPGGPYVLLHTLFTFSFSRSRCAAAILPVPYVNASTRTCWPRASAYFFTREVSTRREPSGALCSRRGILRITCCRR